jgi:hypothetical protein
MSTGGSRCSRDKSCLLASARLQTVLDAHARSGLLRNVSSRSKNALLLTSEHHIGTSGAHTLAEYRNHWMRSHAQSARPVYWGPGAHLRHGPGGQRHHFSVARLRCLRMPGRHGREISTDGSCLLAGCKVCSSNSARCLF